MWQGYAKRAQGLFKTHAMSRTMMLGHLGRRSRYIECLASSELLLRSFSSRSESIKGDSRQNSRSPSGKGRSRRRLQARNSPKAEHKAARQRGKDVRSQSIPPIHRSADGSVTLPEADQTIASMRRRLSRLPGLPPAWDEPSMLVESPTNDERKAIFEEAKTLLDRIRITVRNGTLNPAGKHGHKLSNLMGQVLAIFAQTAAAENDAPLVFDTCCEALTLLHEWNLDMQPLHYACAIEAAARESRWNEAASLFWDQIDPDASGHTPMEISNHIVTGLYAIARSAQVEGGSAVDQVMDAVLRMSMVCPALQNKYVLAAGLALGYAGEGQSFVTYLENSYNRSRFGRSLAGSVMHACVLSSLPDKALEVFEELMSDPTNAGGEWQMGGEYHAVDPVCRDLAMRVLVASTSENVADVAMELFEQVKREELQITFGALCGVVKACELNGKWEEAVKILMYLLDHLHVPGWLLDGDDVMKIRAIDEALAEGHASMPIDIVRRAVPQLGDMVSSVMRSCNSSGRFGMSLLCCRLVDDKFSIIEGYSIAEAALAGQNGELALSLAQTFYRFGSREDLVVAAMTSLSGLGCRDHAEVLYDVAQEGSSGEQWLDAHKCYRYIKSTPPNRDTSLPSPWESAYRHISNLSAACALVEGKKENITEDQRNRLSLGLLKAMRTCTAAEQPETGLLLARRLENVVAPVKDTTTGGFSIRSAMASFFGFVEPESDRVSLLSDGSVLAETIRAYRAMNIPEEALNLLSVIPESFGRKPLGAEKDDATDDVQWIPVINEAIQLLANENRGDDARVLFDSLVERGAQSHETLIAMASALEEEKQWKEIIKIYHHAVQDGLLSERLGMIAMKAVIESGSGSIMQNLRLISRHMSTHCGLGEKQWLQSRYWHIERFLGWKAARLLMWWNDPASSGEMKLQFAVEQFYARQKAGLTPKNDDLRFIVSSVRDYENSKDALPFSSREEWLGFICSVLAEAENSNLWDRPKFVESACLTLSWLGGNKECVEFVSDALNRGVRITSTTLSEATRAAGAENLESEELTTLNTMGTPLEPAR